MILSEYDVVVQHEDDPSTILKDLRIKNKFASIKEIISCNIDILVISETKLDESYSTELFDREVRLTI